MNLVTRFKNAPLLEVVAELRWNTPHDALLQHVVPGMPIQVPESLGAADEEFYGRFAERMDTEGFRASERLFPYGAPSMPGQAVVRFRRKAGVPPLLQVGPGVFTTNGLPPTYSHWGDFRPVLQMGVDSLIATRDPIEHDAPFNLSVRYIDAFGSEYWTDGDPGHFIDEVLGFGSNLPASLQDQLHTDRPKSAAHQLTLPLADGSSHLVLNVGEGEADGHRVVLLDVMVRSNPIDPNLDSVMVAFEKNHSLIRDLFFSITRPIHDKMQPTTVQEGQ